MRRIGYLVPEFPGQTHIFFWRELKDLSAAGLDPVLLSTRHPPQAIVSHSWSDEAKRRTAYLLAVDRYVLSDIYRGLRRTSLRGLRDSLAFGVRNAGSVGEGLAFVGMILPALRLLGIGHRLGFEHVHVHSCANSASAAMIAKWLGGLKYSLTLHGPLSDYGAHQPEKWKHAEFAVVISQKLMMEVRQAIGDRMPEHVDIVGMGVDLERFKRSTPYEPWIGEGPARVFSCGRLNPCKGHQHLIQAVWHLRQAGLNVELDIAGEDEAGGSGYRRILQQQIEKLGLIGNVKLLGAISEDEVIESLHRAHVFALASVAEPLGVAIMEALGMSVPVIATNAGGVPELVTHGKSAILVEPENPETLAAALRSILSDPEMAIAYSRNGRTNIIEFTRRGSSAEVISKRLRLH